MDATDGLRERLPFVDSTSSAPMRSSRSPERGDRLLRLGGRQPWGQDGMESRVKILCTSPGAPLAL